MEIIIGREAGKEQPRLSIQANGKNLFIGEPGSVPRNVSRSHCRIDKGDDGSMKITLIAENNQLFVNGIEYKEKMISASDHIELGADRYRINVADVLAAIAAGPRTAPAKPGQETVDISPLKKVWDEYEKARTDMQIKNGRIGAISTIPGVLSMSSIGLAAFVPNLRFVFLGVAAVMMLAFAIIRWKMAASTPEKNKAIQNKFEDNYTCPSCHRYMNTRSYKLIYNDGACPYCKAKFTGVKP